MTTHSYGGTDQERKDECYEPHVRIDMYTYYEDCTHRQYNAA